MNSIIFHVLPENLKKKSIVRGKIPTSFSELKNNSIMRDHVNSLNKQPFSK